MTKYCCVPCCKETGGFQFPTDPLLKKRWCIAIRRETKNKKLWTPSKHSVVCKKHFKEEDFAKSPFERLRKDLVKGAIPSIFDFVKNKSPAEEIAISARRERNEHRKKVSTVQPQSDNSDFEAEDSSIVDLPSFGDRSIEENEMFFEFDLYGKLLIFFNFIINYSAK
jgi:hypothetical protein